MARNSSGTHSLVAGNPVVTGTTIDSSWANTTLDDVSDEITDSLSRSGKGGMTAPLRGTDGTAAAPAISFTSETGSGWYRSAAGVLRCAILGTYRLLLNATGLEVNGTLNASGAVTHQGTTSLGGNATFTGGSSVITTQANSGITLKGNRDATDTGAELVVNSSVARTLGPLVDIQNDGSSRFVLDYNGEPSVQGGLACGIAIKTDADQTESAGTMTSVTGMAFPVAASGVYHWEIDFPSSAGTNNGCQIQYTGPAAATALSFGFTTNGNGLYSNVNFSAATGPTATTTTAKVMNKSTGILVNGANAGTVQLQFKMAGGGATQAVVYKGALLRWRRLA